MNRHPWDHTIQRHRQTTQALARAVQRPSLWETGVAAAPGQDECVRCFGPLDTGRNAICTGCWKANR